MPNPGDYTIGWVCALSKEFTAAKTMLDEDHPPCSVPPRDTNQYALGKIGKHNVAIAVLPDGEYGLSSAANVATNMLNAFPNIRIGLLVGIGGGAPTSKKDIRLGDVIVSSSGRGTGGVFQYDFGRKVQDMDFQTTGFLNQAPTAIRTAVSAIKTEHDMKGHRIQETIDQGLQRYPKLRKKYSRPPQSHDRLYLSTSVHPPEDRRTCAEACGEGTEVEPKLVKRAERSEDDEDPEVHYGIIASASQLMEDAKIRDKLSSERGIMCFEMEAAGLVNTFPCIVVRGICDYADTHKNDEWQEYAAMTAAAYTKELLSQVSVTRVEEERRMNEVLGHLCFNMEQVKASLEGQSHVINVINSREESNQYQEIIDKLPYVKDAAFDSYSEERNPTCLKNTRVDLLTQISEWVENSDSKTVFWLNGRPGTGKSTISRTVAQMLFSKGMLGASFFFKRGWADQGSATKFCTTIARQLALNQMFFGRILQKAIEQEPDIRNKGLRIQFEKLIIEPFTQAAQHHLTGNSTIAIVVDALDECHSEQDTRLLISLFSQLGTVSGIKSRVFLTSRPEIPLRVAFNSVAGTFQDLILHEIPQPVIEHDIYVFFREEIQKIVLQWNSCTDGSRRLSSDWPGEDNIRILVQRALPLFIFAATTCRFISDWDSSPRTRLNQIIESTSWAAGDEMQATYEPVLDQLLAGLSSQRKADAIREFRLIVGTIILLETPLPVEVLSRLIDIDQDRIHDRLARLHSVLDIPKSPNVPIRLFHLSFRDYLTDEWNYPDNEFMIDYKATSRRISADCMKVMKSHLKTDICDLRRPGTAREEIHRDLINDCLPPELQYACVYWVRHQEVATAEPADTQRIKDFLNIHLLHWIEALVLLNRSWEVSDLLRTLRIVCKNDLSLTDFLEDALRFLNFSITTVDTHPLQLYSHALLFAPESSLVKLNFKSEIPRWISSVPDMNLDWDSCLRLFAEPGYGHAEAISFIPHSTRLFVGFERGGSILLDWNSGKCVKLSHCSPTLSPDGKMIAMPTSHNVVEIRDFQTDGLRGELPADCGLQSKLCFSPNSKLLVVSTRDVCQVWDWGVRTCLYRLPRHNGRVMCDLTRSICFSEDSRLLTTSMCLGAFERFEPCSRHILRVWNCLTGECFIEQTISSSHCFMFTPDSKSFVFVSITNYIEVWSTSTYSRIRDFPPPNFRERHANIQISPDSNFLAYESMQQSIFIFSLTTGQLVSQWAIIQEEITFFRFAPDSKHLIAGIPRGGIQVWSIHTISSFDVTIGLHHGISSADFSPDGRILVTTSRDISRLQVWDWAREVASSKPKPELTTSVDTIRRVRLSPDLTKIAVIFPDRTQLYEITPDTIVRLFDISRDGRHVENFSPDSNYFFFHHDKTHISAFDIRTSVCVWDSYTKDRSLAMCFSDDSRWLAVTTTPTKFCVGFSRILISTTSGDTFKLQHTLEELFYYRLARTTFSSNGRLLASLDEHSHNVLVWDLERPLHEPYVIERCSSIAGFSHSFLSVMNSETQILDIWHVEPRRYYKSVQGNFNFGACFISPSGQLLAIGLDRMVGIFDLRTDVHLLDIHGLYPPTRPGETQPVITFLPGDAGIQTQLGIVDIPQEIIEPPFSSSGPNVIRHTPLFNVCQDSGWIECRGERLLKLPVEYDRYNAVVLNTRVVIPLASRRLIMIGFLDSQLSDALLDKDDLDLYTEGIQDRTRSRVIHYWKFRGPRRDIINMSMIAYSNDVKRYTTP